MFHSTRIKLTLWYVGIILIITGTLSVLFYHGAVTVLEHEFRRIDTRLSQGLSGRGREQIPLRVSREVRSDFLKQNLSNAQRTLATRLLLANGVIAVVVAGASYLLAGRTLKPIEDMVEVQKQFISDASHELRTPITALRTSLEVHLEDTAIPESAKHVLRDNLADVHDLENLSEHLLTLTEYTGTVAGQKHEASTSIVVQRAIKYVAPLAKKKHVTLETQSDDIDTVIRIDETSCVEVLTILLDNAVKYTPEQGMVSLRSRVGKKYWIVNVADTGIGITEDDISHIFDRFYRGNVSRTRQSGKGYGLGLSIAKRVVEHYHGSISVSSEVDRGSVFTVRFPR